MSDLQGHLQSSIGHAYTIERELGGGGMSRVFVATETALGREVVVKILAAELAAGVSADRFTREIATAARLQQANIVPVLSAGDAAGLAYYTMPFVRGESLRARLTRGEGIPIGESVSILRDVARALAYAHGEGVVHRDIKPENILLSGDTAVVTDFGIAKAISAARTQDGLAGGATLTQAGMSLGTPAYMAPEQALGDSGANHRIDLYAWGMIAWELLAGAHPFADRTTLQSIVSAQISEPPPPLAERRRDVPAPLASLVMRCLEKDPARRPQSAREVLSLLDAIATPSSGERENGSSEESGSHPHWWPRVALVAAAVVLIAGSVFIARGRNRTNGAGAAPASAPNVLAVLPFVNTGGDAKDEYFSDGMTDELALALSRLPGLKLAGRSSSFSLKGKSIPAQEVGKMLGVGAIIDGTVRRSGDRLRVTAQLTSTSDGRVLWSDAFERAGTDVFAVQDAFTSAIIGALKPLLGSAPAASASPSIDTRGTTDAVAYDLYLRGRYYWAQRGAERLDTALMYFEQAVKRDPAFARGWAGLSLTHALRPNFNAEVDALPSFEAADAAARKALALDSTLADASLTIAMSLLRRLDLRGAGEWFAKARAREPQNATAHHWSGIYYGVTGDTAQSDREMDAALTLDPLSPTTVNSRATLLYDRRRFDAALDGYLRVRELSPAFFLEGTNWQRLMVWRGKADSVLQASRERARGKSRGRWGNLVFTLAAAGQWDAARQVRATLERPGTPAVMLADRGMAALAFGEYPRAAELLVQSIEREGTLANVFFTLCDPIFDRVQDEPAFIAFHQRHGLPRCARRSPWPIKSPPDVK